MQQYVLVTGAFGGMGKSTVQLLSSKGFHVFAVDKFTDDTFNDNPLVTSLSADLTDINDVTNAFNKVQALTQELHAIIHFAGIYCLDSLVEMSEDKFIKAFNVNFFGVFRVNKVFLPLLKKGSRVVITTSELAPLDPLPFTGIYAITKSALDKYAYSLRMEVQLLDIYVSVIRAGAVNTGLLGNSTDQLDKFIENTSLYKCNAQRFKNIVNSVESRCVSTDKIAQIALRAITTKRPSYVYNLNRNPLLLTLNVLPKKWQTGIIKKILK